MVFKIIWDLKIHVDGGLMWVRLSYGHVAQSVFP